MRRQQQARQKETQSRQKRSGGRLCPPCSYDILGAQIGALEAMGFNRITEGFRRSKVQRGFPMDGTPVFCLESVDWAEAVKQQPKRFSAK